MEMIIHKKLDMGKVRNLCIQENWYTAGDCKEYETMLNRCHSEKNFDKEFFIWVAKDIFEKSEINPSDWDGDEYAVFSSIATKIHNLIVTFVEFL